MIAIDLKAHPAFTRGGNRSLRTALLEIIAGREETVMSRQQAYEARNAATRNGWGAHFVDHVKNGKRRFLWLPVGSLLLTTDGRQITAADAETWLGGPAIIGMDPEVHRRILADLNNWKPIFRQIRLDGTGVTEPLKIRPHAALETQIVGAILNLRGDPQEPIEVLERNLRLSALAEVAEYVKDRRMLLAAKNSAIYDDAGGPQEWSEVNLSLAKSPSLLALSTHVASLNQLKAVRMKYLNGRDVPLEETSRLMVGLCRALCFAAIGTRFAHAVEVALHLASTRVELGCQDLLPLADQDVSDCLAWLEMFVQLRSAVPDALRAVLVLRTAITLRRLGPTRAVRAYALHRFVSKNLTTATESIPHGIVFCEAARYGCVFGNKDAIIPFPTQFESPPVLLEYHMAKAAQEVRLAERSGDEPRMAAASRFRAMLGHQAGDDPGRQKWINRLNAYLNGAKPPGIAKAYPLVETVSKRA